MNRARIHFDDVVIEVDNVQVTFDEPHTPWYHTAAQRMADLDRFEEVSIPLRILNTKSELRRILRAFRRRDRLTFLRAQLRRKGKPGWKHMRHTR